MIRIGGCYIQARAPTEESPWPRRRRRPPSRARTRSRLRPAARAGRRCTRTTRSSTSGGARRTRTGSGSGTRCTSRCRCPRSTSTHRRPVPGRRRVAEPLLRGSAGDGDRLPDRQRLRLHLGQPGHRPGEDRRARRVLPAPRGLLLRALGRALRQVEGEDGGADRGDHRPSRPGPPRVRAGRADARGRPEHRVLRAPRRVRPHAALRRPDVAAPLRAAAAGLRRLRHVLRLLQDQPPRHPRPAHRADGRRASTCSCSSRARSFAGWRSSRSTAASTARSSRAARPRRSTPSSSRARRARPGSRSSSRSRTRGSTWPPATASTTTTAAGTTTRRIAYASIVGHVRALNEGEEVERPSEELARERDRLAEEYGALLDEETRTTFNELLGLSRMVFPYVEEHKFYCDYWFLTRWWNKVREFGALLAKHGFLEDAEDVFQLGRHEVATGARRAAPDLGDRRRAARPEALAADRRAPQGAAREARRLDAAARDRRDARGDHRSDDDHALGRHDAARPGVGERRGGRRAARPARPPRRASSRAPRGS